MCVLSLFLCCCFFFVCLVCFVCFVFVVVGFGGAFILGNWFFSKKCVTFFVNNNSFDALISAIKMC